MRLLPLLLLLLLLLSYCSWHAAVLVLAENNEPAPYTPETSPYTCDAGDGTYNWNSFVKLSDRGEYATTNPGKCMIGAILNWPYFIGPTSPGSTTTIFQYNVSNMVFPSVQCKRFYDFYPPTSGIHSYPDTYGSPPADNLYVGYNQFDFFNTHLYLAWGVHIIKGFRCIFSCPDPSIQYMVAPYQNQIDFYSDGNQRTCHPSRMNQTNGVCVDQAATTQRQAPYCFTRPVCYFRWFRFYTLKCSFNNTNLPMSSTPSITKYIDPGDSCTVTINRQSWNTYYSGFNNVNSLIFNQGTTSQTSFTMSCPSDTTSAVNIEPTVYNSFALDYWYFGTGLYGNYMSSCPSGFFGPTCLPCQPCNNWYTKCDDGVTGTGKCFGPYNPCTSRTTNYGLTFYPDPSSSTGLCKQSAPIASSNTITLRYVDPSDWQTSLFPIALGTVIIQNWGSWLDTRFVSYTARVETMTFVPNPLVTDPKKTFCNGRGQLYGSFQFDYQRYWSDDRSFFNTAFVSSYATNPCECYAGYYGDQCQHTCSIQYNTTSNKVCDPVTGTPTCALNTELASNGTCVPTLGCKFNTWGTNCDKPCPFCSAPLSRCDRSTGQCQCPDPTQQLDKNGTSCTSYHCGAAAASSQAICGGTARGTCQDSVDGLGRTCYCKPGYHGRYCELSNKAYTPALTGGLAFEDRDCDCGVVWSDYVPSLDQVNKSLSVIGIVSWPTQYRDHYKTRLDTDFDISFMDTNKWTVPIIWNRVMTLAQARQWCYEYRPCDGFMATLYSEGGGGGGGYFYITPIQNNTVTFTNNSLLYSNLWVGTPNTTVTSGSQVSVYFIQRSLGYDCRTTDLDVKWYFGIHYNEIMYDYGTRFCDLSHRQDENNPNSACCINTGTGDARYCDYPKDHGALPKPDYINGPFVQWTRRHYDEIGHRKRYAPNPYCDLWPSLYEESPPSLCLAPKDGCKQAFTGALPCSGRGRCRPNANGTIITDTNRPYKCVCAKFDPTLTSELYYSDETDKLNNKDTRGRRKYLGYACEADLNNCIKDVSDGADQDICNKEIARCVGLAYPLNSTFAEPGSITPHCDCNLINPAQQLFQESVNTGAYCDQSRCGIDNQGCNRNSSTASCVFDPLNNQRVCQCSVDGKIGDLWIGPSCQIPADTCRPPAPDQSGLYRLCGGPGFGTCREAGSGISTTPNWNASYPWCDCSNSNYTGLHCSKPNCTSDVVESYHGYCLGDNQDQAHCYPMWGEENQRCTINKCDGFEKGGGFPTDSGLPGSEPQDICQCTIGREARKSTGKRPGFDNDPLNAPSSVVGYCFPKCPTTNDNDYIPQYCGGHGYCIDPVHNTNTSIAQCICNIGYINDVFTHPQWNTTQNTCVPYCKNGGYVDMTADEWGAYLRNPFTSVQPTCTCPNDENGYYNDPDNPDSKTCEDKRCGPDGIWTPDTIGNGGTCECGPSRKLYYPVYGTLGISGCKISRCSGKLPDGTEAYRGIVSLDGNTCSCFSPFTWNNTDQKSDCDSDICHPNGNLFNNTVYSDILDDFMNVPINTTTGVGLCKCTEPFRTTGCTSIPGLRCQEYCKDSSCPNGGTPINNNRNNCSCPAPFVNGRCKNPCAQLTGVADTTLGKCQCLYGWTGDYCTIDPCNVGCPTPTRPCGKFNLTTLSCDCYDAWMLQGTSCGLLNVTRATADCNSPHGSATGPSSCLCSLLWTGSNCNISACVAPGSTTIFDTTIGVEKCVCPDGYSGLLCDTILLPPPSSSSSSLIFSTANLVLTSVSGLVILGFISKYGLYPLYLKYVVLKTPSATATIVASKYYRYKK